MKNINQIYINGAFVTPQGTETFDLISPVTNQKTGEVVLGNDIDIKNGITAAKNAFKSFSKISKEDRIEYILKIHEVLKNREQELIDVMVQEYGGTLQFCTMSVKGMISNILIIAEMLKSYDFEKTVGSSKVRLEALGVVGIITPWNASNAFVISKLTTAIAAGCTAVIKPSEMSAAQTQLLTECLHEVGLPKGVFNIINGAGNVVGAELATNPDVAKISFTGSTVVGKSIARNAVETMKRITLELGGKSPNIILDDADFEKAIPMAVYGAFMNSGQACIAPTRLLVPEHRLDEVNALAKATAEAIKVGNPADAESMVGPMVSKKQYERVQSYIKIGQAEGAVLLTGGLGQPTGLEDGNFVKATIFTNVTNDMRIAREEIFGPVLSILTYRNEEEAVAIANDTIYGLAAYVSGSTEHANAIAKQIEAGRVCVNGFSHDPQAPFGGYKQSGIGREYGVYGLEAYLEPKAILG